MIVFMNNQKYRYFLKKKHFIKAFRIKYLQTTT
jgi:hypothetical protein